MPVFDYKCKACERKITDEFVHRFDDDVVCKQCGAVMSKLVPLRIKSGEMSRNDQLDGVYLEHVSPNGETFHSKREMKKYAKDNNLQLGYLE